MIIIYTAAKHENEELKIPMMMKWGIEEKSLSFGVQLKLFEESG